MDSKASQVSSEELNKVKQQYEHKLQRLAAEMQEREH